MHSTLADRERLCFLRWRLQVAFAFRATSRATFKVLSFSSIGFVDSHSWTCRVCLLQTQTRDPLCCFPLRKVKRTGLIILKCHVRLEKLALFWRGFFELTFINYAKPLHSDCCRHVPIKLLDLFVSVAGESMTGCHNLYKCQGNILTDILFSAV